MCYLGQKFNLDASESAGFFQGIVTAISIITGFSLINYQTKQKEQNGIENLKQSVRDFKLYVEHLFPDPITEITRQEKTINSHERQMPNNLRFMLKIVIIEKIFSKNNKQVLEKQYFIARESLIKLRLSKDLETLSSAYVALQATFLMSDDISKLAKNILSNNTSNITANQQSQLDSKIKQISTLITSLKNMLSFIHFTK